MPYTQQDLIVRVLRRLGEIGDGQDPTPEAVAKVRDVLPGVLADLRGRSIYGASSNEVFEDGAMPHLSAILASEMADDFGLSGEDLVTTASRAQAAEQKLRQLRAMDLACTPSRATYF